MFKSTAMTREKPVKGMAIVAGSPAVREMGEEI